MEFKDVVEAVEFMGRRRVEFEKKYPTWGDYFEMLQESRKTESGKGDEQPGDDYFVSLLLSLHWIVADLPVDIDRADKIKWLLEDIEFYGHRIAYYTRDKQTDLIFDQLKQVSLTQGEQSNKHLKATESRLRRKNVILSHKLEEANKKAQRHRRFDRTLLERIPLFEKALQMLGEMEFQKGHALDALSKANDLLLQKGSSSAVDANEIYTNSAIYRAFLRFLKKPK